MLIDNENKKVYEWLSGYTNGGTLGFLSQITNKI